MTEETFQKYEFMLRAKAAFQLYNLIDYHKDFEDVKDEKKEIENLPAD